MEAFIARWGIGGRGEVWGFTDTGSESETCKTKILNHRERTLSIRPDSYRFSSAQDKPSH